MDIKVKLGAKLKQLRKDKNLSQEKFALSIDMDRTYYASVESGKRNVSLDNLYKICHVTSSSLRSVKGALT